MNDRRACPGVKFVPAYPTFGRRIRFGPINVSTDENHRWQMQLRQRGDGPADIGPINPDNRDAAIRDRAEQGQLRCIQGIEPGARGFQCCRFGNVMGHGILHAGFAGSSDAVAV
jgi:hypothetical protein